MSDLALAAANCPDAAAMISGVCPSSSRASTSAPFSINTCRDHTTREVQKSDTHVCNIHMSLLRCNVQSCPSIFSKSVDMCSLFDQDLFHVCIVCWAARKDHTFAEAFLP